MPNDEFPNMPLMFTTLDHIRSTVGVGSLSFQKVSSALSWGKSETFELKLHLHSMNFRLIWAFLAGSALHAEDAEQLSHSVCGRCFSKNALRAMGRTKSRSKRIFDMSTLTSVT